MEYISSAMRDFLVLHLDQAHVPVIHNFASIPDKFERRRLAWQAKSREAALRQGWVRTAGDRRFTVMTERGRMALARSWPDGQTPSKLSRGRSGTSAAMIVMPEPENGS